MSTTISGIGASIITTCSQANVIINANCHDNFQLPVNVFILRSLTDSLPASTLSSGPWQHISDLVLVDPTYNVPGKIDMLLGADVYATILMDLVRLGPAGTPIAQKTKLGWVLSGPTSAETSAPVQSKANIVSCFNQIALNNNLKQFWEMEECQNQIRTQTRDEIVCEQFYDSTYQRSTDGRFIVRLPFNEKFQKSMFWEHPRLVHYHVFINWKINSTKIQN